MQISFTEATGVLRRTSSQPYSAELTWAHTVAPDALLDEVCSHGLGEANHGRLGRAVYTSVNNSWGGREGSIMEEIKNVVSFRKGTQISVLSNHWHASFHLSF